MTCLDGMSEALAASRHRPVAARFNHSSPFPPLPRPAGLLQVPQGLPACVVGLQLKARL